MSYSITDKAKVLAKNRLDKLQILQSLKPDLEELKKEYPQYFDEGGNLQDVYKKHLHEGDGIRVTKKQRDDIVERQKLMVDTNQKQDYTPMAMAVKKLQEEVEEPSDKSGTYDDRDVRKQTQFGWSTIGRLAKTIISHGLGSVPDTAAFVANLPALAHNLFVEKHKKYPLPDKVIDKLSPEQKEAYKKSKIAIPTIPSTTEYLEKTADKLVPYLRIDDKDRWIYDAIGAAASLGSPRGLASLVSKLGKNTAKNVATAIGATGSLKKSHLAAAALGSGTTSMLHNNFDYGIGPSLAAGVVASALTSIPAQKALKGLNFHDKKQIAKNIVDEKLHIQTQMKKAQNDATKIEKTIESLQKEIESLKKEGGKNKSFGKEKIGEKEQLKSRFEHDYSNLLNRIGDLNSAAQGNVRKFQRIGINDPVKSVPASLLITDPSSIASEEILMRQGTKTGKNIQTKFQNLNKKIVSDTENVISDISKSPISGMYEVGDMIQEAVKKARSGLKGKKNALYADARSIAHGKTISSIPVLEELQNIEDELRKNIAANSTVSKVKEAAKNIKESIAENMPESVKDSIAKEIKDASKEVTEQTADSITNILEYAKKNGGEIPINDLMIIRQGLSKIARFNSITESDYNKRLLGAVSAATNTLYDYGQRDPVFQKSFRKAEEFFGEHFSKATGFHPKIVKIVKGEISPEKIVKSINTLNEFKAIERTLIPHKKYNVSPEAIRMGNDALDQLKREKAIQIFSKAIDPSFDGGIRHYQLSKIMSSRGDRDMLIYLLGEDRYNKLKDLSDVSNIVTTRGRVDPNKSGSAYMHAALDPKSMIGRLGDVFTSGTLGAKHTYSPRGVRKILNEVQSIVEGKTVPELKDYVGKISNKKSLKYLLNNSDELLPVLSTLEASMPDLLESYEKNTQSGRYRPLEGTGDFLQKLRKIKIENYRSTMEKQNSIAQDAVMEMRGIRKKAESDRRILTEEEKERLMELRKIKDHAVQIYRRAKFLLDSREKRKEEALKLLEQKNNLR